MLHRLLNQSEEITYARLSAVCEREGAHVYPKVRLADIFPIAHSGVSDEDYRFSLQGHFDFTVTNKDYDPLFAVEFDSRFHRPREQRARDERKDACVNYSIPEPLRYTHPG